ncbi:Pulmonary surfactant-associated protein D [Myotis davidii]|uniref:Pulmonary surfactant-associated protein D n=1 Tax=Myotis davidii TaxID=225400 RepID=L5LQQ0_MYODS|nr:Pulmonary surfactant-associated protein D [Myotis davidii]
MFCVEILEMEAHLLGKKSPRHSVPLKHLVTSWQMTGFPEPRGVFSPPLAVGIPPLGSSDSSHPNNEQIVGSPGATGRMEMLDVPKEDNSSAGDPGLDGNLGPPDISALWRQLEALQGQVRRLQEAFLQYKKVELYPNGRDVGQKVFKTAGFVKSFYQAEQMCSQSGGQLPSPRSTAENHALQQLVELENSGAAFLSMTDFWTEGRFTYPDGASLVYSNWAPGEPNDDSGREDCVEIISNGKWNDVPCGAKRLVICEF